MPISLVKQRLSSTVRLFTRVIMISQYCIASRILEKSLQDEKKKDKHSQNYGCHDQENICLPLFTLLMFHKQQPDHIFLFLPR